jgi:ElaB/YqjD/DUF883 family membrane-anchored ribosome-binding protein
MAEENHMNQGPAGSSQAGAVGGQHRGQQSRSGMANAGQTVQSSGTPQATENLAQSTTVAGKEVLGDAKERLRTLKEDTDDYVRRNPAKAVFTALGIGFVLGLMRRRR